MVKEFAMLGQMATFDASPLKSVARKKGRRGTGMVPREGQPLLPYFMVSPNLLLLPLLLNMWNFMTWLKVTSIRVLC